MCSGALPSPHRRQRSWSLRWPYFLCVAPSALASLVACTMEGILSATFLPLASSVLSMSSGPSTVLAGRWHVPRQGSDPLQPGTHRREALQVVAALRTQARVHIEGDVCDRGTIPDEKLASAQMPLHHPEGPVALLQELLQLGPSLGRHLDAPHAPQAR